MSQGAPIPLTDVPPSPICCIYILTSAARLSTCLIILILWVSERACSGHAFCGVIGVIIKYYLEPFFHNVFFKENTILDI